MKRIGNVLLFGGNGQLGQELLTTLGPLTKVTAATRTGRLRDGSSCEMADFQQPATLTALLERVSPDWVVNAAAYTDVDGAEDEREQAWCANVDAPAVIARWCAASAVPVLHYSSDYVFDGQGTRPYLETDATAPLGVYGASKLAGEDAIRAAGGRHLIFRTAWVYASHSSNFLRTMLRVGAGRDVLKVVADQVGTPTPAALIAKMSARVMQHSDDISGTWHLTTQGHTSWHGFAEAIFAAAVERGILATAPTVEAITTAEYPSKAKRPAYSRLDCSKFEADFGIALPSWQDGLATVMAQIR